MSTPLTMFSNNFSGTWKNTFDVKKLQIENQIGEYRRYEIVFQKYLPSYLLALSCLDRSPPTWRQLLKKVALGIACLDPQSYSSSLYLIMLTISGRKRAKGVVDNFIWDSFSNLVLNSPLACFFFEAKPEKIGRLFLKPDFFLCRHSEKACKKKFKVLNPKSVLDCFINRILSLTFYLF